MSENGSRRVVEFDIDRYCATPRRLDLTQIDWEDIPNHPLTDGDVMCLHYMMDIETHTVIYLRDLLATRAAHDPYVTGVPLLLGLRGALARRGVLGLPARVRHRGAGRAASCRTARRRCPPARRARRRFRERMGVGHKLFLLPTMFGSLLMRDFVALHMTWGAINELTTLTGYYQLIRRSDHPVLHQMLAPRDPGRAAPLRLLPRAGEGAPDRQSARRPAWCAGR